MNEISALNSAIAGIQKGLSGARKNAAEIARAGTEENYSTEGFIKPAVELKQNSLQVQASAKVLKTVDDMIGSLLDEKA
jgi:hypothetical protein